MAAVMAAIAAPAIALTIPSSPVGAGPLIISDGHYPTGETASTNQGPVPRPDCGPGSRPNTAPIMGQTTIADRESGRSAKGYTCNMQQVGRYSPDDPQGFEGAEWQFGRYKDCAYYSQRLAGAGLPSLDIRKGITPKMLDELGKSLPQQRPGTVVLDVSNPKDPKFADNLTTPGMLDPWETLKVNQKRGLLAATNVLDGEGAGLFEIYDIKQDCKHPKLLSSRPLASVINHEGNWAPDGKTYYSGGLTPGIVTAIDTADPRNPKTLSVFWAHLGTHGMSVSPDGRRLYLGHINDDWAYTLPLANDGTRPSLTGGNGLGVYDVSAIQDRKPNNRPTLVSALEWGGTDGQINQMTLPIRQKGHPYIISVDEAGHGGARIIDMANERKPTVVSKVKTEIMMPKNLEASAKDVRRIGGQTEIGGILQFGYNFHYCNVDKLEDPSMLACSAFEQGVRVFDIRDLQNPKEIAYFNPGGDGRLMPGSFGGTFSGYPAAMPQFVPSKHQLWFSDQDRGVYVTKFTNGTWISDATDANTSHGN